MSTCLAAPKMRTVREIRITLAIPSMQSAVSIVVAQVCTWLRGHGVPEPLRQDVELVLAEALNNVVEHAYLYREDGEIELTVRLTPEEMTLEIVDSGQSFEGPPPPREISPEELALEDLPEGGFGWNLIHTLTDDVSYRHEAGRNYLLMRRALPERMDLL